MTKHLYISLASLLIGASVYAQTDAVVRINPADSAITTRNTVEHKAIPPVSVIPVVTANAEEQIAQLPEKSDESYFLLQATPNLTTGRTKVQITSSKGGSADIYLMNFRGDKIKSIYKGQLNAGVSNFSFDTANIGDGLYYIITNLESQQYADKFLVDRQ